MKIGDLVEITKGISKGKRGVIRHIGAFLDLVPVGLPPLQIWSEWNKQWDGKLKAVPEGQLSWIWSNDVKLVEEIPCFEPEPRKLRLIELEDE